MRSSLRAKRTAGRQAWQLSSSTDSEQASGLSDSSLDSADSIATSFSTTTASDDDDDEEERDEAIFGAVDHDAMETVSLVQYKDGHEHVVGGSGGKAAKKGWLAKQIHRITTNSKYRQWGENFALLSPAIFIEYVWSINELLLMQYLLQLKVPTTVANLVWLFNPVIGIMGQPMIGLKCDTNTNNGGVLTKKRCHFFHSFLPSIVSNRQINDSLLIPTLLLVSFANH